MINPDGFNAEPLPPSRQLPAESLAEVLPPGVTAPPTARHASPALRLLALAVIDDLRKAACDYSRDRVKRFMESFTGKSYSGEYGPAVENALDAVLGAGTAPANCRGDRPPERLAGLPVGAGFGGAASTNAWWRVAVPAVCVVAGIVALVLLSRNGS